METQSAQFPGRQHNVRRSSRRADGIFRVDRAAHHQGDEIVLREPVVDIVGALAFAVAQNGHPVGESEGLRQSVAHIDDRGARGDDPMDDVAQLFDTGNVEARGRLIEEEDLRVRSQCLDDLEELALRRAQMSDQGIWRNTEIVGSKLLCGPLPLSTDSRGAIHGPEEEVLRHGQLAHQRVVLIDDGQAELARLQRIGGDKRLAHDRHPAFVREDRTAGDAEERALARAVLAHDGVNFAGPAFEVDPVERLYAGIALRDAGQFERGSGHSRHIQDIDRPFYL